MLGRLGRDSIPDRKEENQPGLLPACLPSVDRLFGLESPDSLSDSEADPFL